MDTVIASIKKAFEEVAEKVQEHHLSFPRKIALAEARIDSVTEEVSINLERQHSVKEASTLITKIRPEYRQKPPKRVLFTMRARSLSLQLVWSKSTPVLMGSTLV